MKKILLFLSLLLVTPLAHADRTGTIVSAGVTVGSSSNTFASAYQDEINGGAHVAADTTERDAIPAARRVVGMTCYVISDGKTYRLVGGIANANWSEVTTSSSDNPWQEVGSSILPKVASRNVGIGTTLPAERLDVNGNGRFGGSGSETISSTTGTIKFCGVKNINNECVDMDMETVANRISFNPTVTGVTSVNFPLIMKMNRLMVGSVDQINYNIDLSGVTTGLVSYYKMEDNTSTTTVTDEQGTNDGIAPANTSTMSVTGKIGRGLALDSSLSQFIDLGSGSSLKFTGDFTVTFWFKTASSGTTMRVMGNRSASGTNTGWEVFINSSGAAGMQVDTPDGLQSVTGTTVVTGGSWYQAIAKRSGSVISLKINNSAEGSPTGASTGDCGTGADNTYLGRTPQTAQYYNGSLDNLRIFNRATTDAEDAILYNAGNGNEANGAGSNVVYLKMEDNAASTAVTDSTGLQTVTATVNTSTLTTTGKIDNGFTLSGSRYLDLGSDSTLKFTGDFAVNVWVNTTTAGVARIAGNRSASGTNIGWDLAKDGSNHATFIIDQGATSYSVTGTTSLIDGAWHMITARRQGGTISVWVDGVSQGTPTGSNSDDIGTSADNTYVGRTPFSANYWNNKLDSFSEYSRALTDDEIAILYNGGRGTDTLSGATTTLVNMFSTNKVVNPIFSSAINTGNDVFIQRNLELDGALYAETGIIDIGNVSIGTSDNTGGRLIVTGGNVGIGTTLANGGALIVTGGNVGLGTLHPGKTLDVFGDIRASNSGKFYGDGSSLTGVGTNYWVTGNVGINTTNNVGLGSTNPGQKLDIVGTVRATAFSGPLTGNASTATALATSGTSCSAGNYPLGVDASGNALNCTSASGGAALWVAGSVGINTTSNVGIGSSNPGQKLDVTGTVRATAFVGDGTGITGISGSGTVNSGTINQFAYYATTGTAVSSQTPLSTDGTNIGVGTAGPSTLFDINRKFNVLSGGNIGVGSINPGTVLDVVGSERVQTNIGIGTTSPATALWVGNGVYTVTSGGTATQTSTNTTTSPWTLTANSLSTASGINASNSNTSFSGRGLINSTLSGSSSNLSGSALFSSVTGASSVNARVVEFADSAANDTTPFVVRGVTGNVGIGTLTPQAQLDIRFQTPTPPLQIGSSATDATGAFMKMDTSGNLGIGTVTPSAPLSVTGHIHSHGTAPTVASNDCGSTSQGTVTSKSTDVAGGITVGTLAVTSCAMTFNSTWLNAPQCIAVDDSNVLAIKASTTTTKLTLNSTTSMSGDVVSYICIGNE